MTEGELLEEMIKLMDESFRQGVESGRRIEKFNQTLHEFKTNKGRSQNER